MKELALYDYQAESIQLLRNAFSKGHRVQMFYAPTGAGKCLGINTPVLMADGSVKPVQEIIVGDKLMGPDSKIRNVLSITSGREMLYKINPIKGDPYIVNESHILSLRKVSGSDGIYLSDGTHITKDQDIVNVNVKVLIDSNQTAKWCLKGWRSGEIEFNNEYNLPIPPYILGIWIGDGSHKNPVICKPYAEVIQAWIDYGISIGLNYSVDDQPTRCNGYRLTNGRNRFEKKNIFLELLKDLNLVGNKHIPDIYRTASINDRLELIAGLLDTDGFTAQGGYDFLNKDENIVDAMVFLCRSVGLSAYKRECQKGIKTTGVKGTYYRISISGDCHKIPCKQKPAAINKQIKRGLVHGIKIEKIGIGDYFGFEIDGDKLFLLGDFTVTHNTEIAIAIMAKSAGLGKNVAMCMDRRILVNQTSTRLDKYEIDHGVIMAKHWRYCDEHKIQICSVQTIEALGSFPDIDLLIYDEAHCLRKSVIEFIKNNQKIKVIGLSASPFTKGLGNVFSIVTNCTTTKKLVEEHKKLTPLKVFLATEIDMTGAKKVAGEWSQDEVTKRGIVITGDIVTEWVKKTNEIFGKPVKTVVFCSGVAHGLDIQNKFQDAGYNFVSISYKDDDNFKAESIAEFSKPDSKIMGLIATDILTKGWDSPDCLIGISARPFSKSFSSHTQQMGRLMRAYPGKNFAVWIDHSGNYLRFRNQWDNLYDNGVSDLSVENEEKPVKELTKEEKETAKCPVCQGLWSTKTDTCPHCGHVRIRRNEVKTIAGELHELGAKVEKFNAEYKQDFYEQLLGYSRERGYADGWAFHKYIAKFGVNPPWKKIPRPPGYEVMGYIKYQQIRYAKGIAKK